MQREIQSNKSNFKTIKKMMYNTLRHSFITVEIYDGHYFNSHGNHNAAIYSSF